MITFIAEPIIKILNSYINNGGFVVLQTGEIIQLLFKFTAEPSHLVSHPEMQLFPPVPSALWKPNTPMLRGCDSEDNDSKYSDHKTSNKQRPIKVTNRDRFTSISIYNLV